MVGFSDLRTEDSASVGLDRRADDFRAINSITLCEQIVSGPASGREFFLFFALFDRRTLSPRIRCFFRAPVAQLDRASDYGFKPNELHIVSPRCTALLTRGISRHYRSRNATQNCAVLQPKILRP